jgi:CelD/BcsL family acetyltransferase involved in cellulose biosynthesis
VVALQPTWEQQRSHISKSLRTQIQQRRRALERDFTVEIDAVRPDDVGAALDDLFWLHDRRWRRRGLAGAFSDKRVRSFHKALAPQLAERGWLRLYRLRLDGKTRALFYCFQRGERVYYYLSGFDVALQRWSLGTVLMAEMVAQSISSGARELDLMRGDENYKRLWRATETHTVRLVLTQQSRRAQLARSAIWVERQLELAGMALHKRLFGHRKS